MLCYNRHAHWSRCHSYFWYTYLPPFFCFSRRASALPASLLFLFYTPLTYVVSMHHEEVSRVFFPRFVTSWFPRYRSVLSFVSVAFWICNSSDLLFVLLAINYYLLSTWCFCFCVFCSCDDGWGILQM